MTDPKQFTTARARAAIAGLELRTVMVESEAYRFALHQGGEPLVEADDLFEIENFLDRVESRRLVLEGTHAS